MPLAASPAAQPVAAIGRDMVATLKRTALGFPVITLTGPRQSGKTTLTRLAFPDKPYLSLEDAQTRARAELDPKSFLAALPNGAVLDEAQRAPVLFSELQGVVDTRAQMGEFILTGSQQFGLMNHVAQSLAGRAAVLQLLPCSAHELHGAGRVPFTLEQALWHGGYPALFDQRRQLDPRQWLDSYIATYIERDVRLLLNVVDGRQFHRFLLMCAARVGQQLNLSSLANDCGLSHSTAQRWLTVLQASYIITLLTPHHRNFGKRLVKSPKLYFLDTGLLCRLLQVEAPEALRTHALRGAIFESWVVSETLKHRWNRGLDAPLYFWRDHHGVEVDLVFEQDGLLHGVEIKSSATFASDWQQALATWRRYAGIYAAPPTLVYGGEESFQVLDLAVMSWRDFSRG